MNYQDKIALQQRIKKETADTEVQDTVGAMLVDTATIDFTYNNSSKKITAAVKDDAITKDKINADIAGTNLQQAIDGSIELVDSPNITGSYLIDGTQIVTARQAAIVDANTAHTVNATFSSTQVKAALDALGAKINEILAAARTHGLISS